MYDMNTRKQTVDITEKRALIREIKPWASIEWYSRYSWFSTAMGLAFPKVCGELYREWFERTLLNHQLMLQEEKSLFDQPITWTGPYHQMMKLLRAGPAIICTFHTGSYRLINPYLLKHAQMPISLLVSEDFIRSESDSFGQRLRALDLPSGVDFSTISATHPSSALQILRRLAAGVSILAYVDGNMGADSASREPKNDSRMELEFFGLPVKVRIGLPALAHRAGVPLICVFTRRGAECETIFHITRIIPDPKAREGDSLRFARRLTRDMYRDLEGILRSEPWQWDMWFYFHRFLL